MTETDRLAQIRAEQEHLLRAERRRRLGHSVESSTYAPGPWAHVPLLDLFRHFGHTLHRKNAREYETTHHQHPVSKSGRTVVIWPAEGRWYCRKCQRVYDAVDLVREHQGVGYQSAVDWLVERYGAPRGWGQRPSARPAPAPKACGRALVWRELRP